MRFIYAEYFCFSWHGTHEVWHVTSDRWQKGLEKVPKFLPIFWRTNFRKQIHKPKWQLITTNLVFLNIPILQQTKFANFKSFNKLTQSVEINCNHLFCLGILNAIFPKRKKDYNNVQNFVAIENNPFCHVFYCQISAN